MNSKILAFAMLLLGCAGPVFSQSFSSKNVMNLDKPENAPRATIADVAWLAGAWRVEGLGGNGTEIWAPPDAGSMVSLFRFVKDGRVVFYEIVILKEEKGSLVMKLKHFDAELVGWEERSETVNFPLVRITPNEVNLSGITLRKRDDGCLDVYVLIQQKEGQPEEVPFRYCRQ